MCCPSYWLRSAEAGDGQVTVARLQATAPAVAESLLSLLTAPGLTAAGLDARTHAVIDDAPALVVRAKPDLVI